MKPEQRAYFELHLSVLLFGLTALLGGLLELSAIVIVWWRVLLTSISLIFLIRVRYLFKNLPLKSILIFSGIGIIVGLHWVAFYGAVKLSNVSICLVGMSTTSIFTAFLEPLFFKQKIKYYEVLLSFLIVPGMILVVNATDFSLLSGLWVAMVSALLSSLFAILNKKHLSKADEMSITFLELGSAWLFLSLLIPIYSWISGEQLIIMPPRIVDWIYLLILALLCTTFAYVLALKALRYISAFTSNLALNLEPVYGILLAWIILKENEELSTGFYWGVVIILLAVFSHPFLKKWREGKS
ncbi:MAG: EamA family transporter [Bacteroidota bacterium]